MHAGRAGVLNHTHTCGRLRLRSHIGSNRIRTHSKPTFPLQQPADPIPSLRQQHGRAECQEIGREVLGATLDICSCIRRANQNGRYWHLCCINEQERMEACVESFTVSLW